MNVIDIEKIVADYGNSVFHDDLKRVDSASAFEISAIARKLGLNSMYDFDDTGYHLDVSSLVESLTEAKEENKLETFEDKMNFLAKDEQEAIDGYDKVLVLLDAEKDAIVIEQLNKIKIEEEAHKKYLEDVKENHDLVYTEPLDLEEGASCSEDFTEKGKQLIKDARDAGLISFYDPYAGNFSFTKETYDENQEKIQKWLENHDEYGVIRQEASIYKDTDLENSSDGYAYFLTDWGFDEDESSPEDIIIKPKALSEDLNEKVEYIEMPHEVYETPEDIKRINDELDKKAREGKLIGIRKEPKMLMLSEPEINGIWTIYLNDKGFIEKIVLF